MKDKQSQSNSKESTESDQTRSQAVLSNEEIAEVVAVFKLLSKWRDEARNSVTQDKSSQDEK